MSFIGKQLKLLTGKPASQINESIKRLTAEKIPSAEELSTAISDMDMTLSEYVAFLSEPPDIILEKELNWPVDPDLLY
jgi:hypothetical protein